MRAELHELPVDTVRKRRAKLGSVTWHNEESRNILALDGSESKEQMIDEIIAKVDLIDDSFPAYVMLGGASDARQSRGALLNQIDVAGMATAVCTTAPMHAGRHYAEFTVTERSEAAIGVCSDRFDPRGNGHCTGQCQTSTDPCMAPVSHSDKGWLVSIRRSYDHNPRSRGLLSHNNTEHRWPGHKGAKLGDRIGLLLDMNEGSLAVYKNDARLGVAVTTGLPRGLCWCAELEVAGSSQRDSGGAGVRI